MEFKIRNYKESDCSEVYNLFYNTVHKVNAKDYSKEQLDVWAVKNPDLDKWNKSLLSHYSIVAVIEDEIVGFGDIYKTGYLDRLFVHKDNQGKGIASILCEKLENRFDIPKIITHASITAKPFFEKRNYIIIKEQEVERSGVILRNYVMEKRL